MKYIESRTKIIATLGPASTPIDVLRQMFIAGLDVCRLNFSHGKYEDHKKCIDTIRLLNTELNMNVAILVDLQGPKLRVGEMENNGVELISGKELIFSNQKCIGTAERVYMSYPEFPRDVKPGEFVLVDDGKIKLEVLSTNGIDEVRAKVIYGGILSSKKGVNLPNTKISQPSMTEKDKQDAEFALQNDADWIALSFVREAADILELKQLIKQHHKHAGVVSKIEKPEAISDIDQIIDLSDGVMIARGDMGVELDFYMVPLLQKEIIKKCHAAAKPVIVATQMMESMITNFRPTRAEASDVANAVLEGTDMVMLSGETSVGKFPVGVIETMHQILQWTEEKQYHYHIGNPPTELDRTFMEDNICYNAVKAAQYSEAKAIITFTHNGYSAYKIAGYRPKAKIWVFTDNKQLISKLSLVWGVKAIYFEFKQTIDEAISTSISTLKSLGELTDGNMVIHAGSMPLDQHGRTNMMKISYV